MVGSLPDGCTRLGRSAPEEDRLAKWNEEVNRTGGQRIGEEKYNAETLRTQRKAKQRKAKKRKSGPPRMAGPATVGEHKTRPLEGSRYVRRVAPFCVVGRWLGRVRC